MHSFNLLYAIAQIVVGLARLSLPLTQSLFAKGSYLTKPTFACSYTLQSKLSFLH